MENDFQVGSGGVSGWGESARPEEIFSKEKILSDGSSVLAPTGGADKLEPSPMDGRFLAG